VGISCNKDNLYLFRHTGGHLLQGEGDIRHVQRTQIRAMGVSEKEQGDVSLGLLPEIKRSGGGIGQSESRFW
jgi:hypothetical protein